MENIQDWDYNAMFIVKWNYLLEELMNTQHVYLQPIIFN